jgi:hypothetical protein
MDEYLPTRRRQVWRAIAEAAFVALQWVGWSWSVTFGALLADGDASIAVVLSVLFITINEHVGCQLSARLLRACFGSNAPALSDRTVTLATVGPLHSVSQNVWFTA